MSKIDEMLKQMCPDGVEYRPLWSLTTWDKRFNSISKEKQQKTISFKHVDAKTLKELYFIDGNIKLLSTGNFNGFTSRELGEQYINDAQVIAIPSGGTANIKYWSGEFIDSGNILAVSSDKEKYDLKYVYYYLLNIQNLVQSYYRGSGIQHPDMSAILDLKIPAPPLEIQKEIVKVLDTFTKYDTELQAELQARIKQYEYYRNKLLSFDEMTPEGGQVEWQTLGDIGEVCMCKRILKSQTQNTGVPFFKIGTFGKKEDSYISEEIFKEYSNKYNYPKKGDILISAAGTIGRTVIFDGRPAYFQDSNIVWIDNDEKKVLNKYLYYFYQTNPWVISSGGTIARIYNDDIKRVRIAIPPLHVQSRVVSVLDNFNKICSDLKIGLPAEIEKRQKQYEHYRNKLLTFLEKK